MNLKIIAKKPHKKIKIVNDELQGEPEKLKEETIKPKSKSKKKVEPMKIKFETQDIFLYI